MYELIGKQIYFPDTEANRKSAPFRYNHVIPNKMYEVLEYSDYPSKGKGPRIRCEDNSIGDVPMAEAEWDYWENYGKEAVKEYSNKYQREIKPGVFVDVYDVLKAFNVTDPCLQHAAKKVLAAGERGHKDRLEDLNDIVASANRAIEMHKEWS